MNKQLLNSLVAIVLASGLSGQTAAQQDWSSFQNGGSLQDEAWSLPTQWNPESGIEWETKLAGYGQSSPVLYGQTVYVTSVTGDNKETLNVQALSLEDGKERWKFTCENSSPEENTVMVSRAAPTPVADDNGLIAFFEGGNLVALSHEGDVRWQRDLKKETGELKARHGLAASLEQNSDHVFVWCERSDSPYVMAISKTDGETVWKKPGLGSTSWSSPRLVEVDGSSQLVLSAIGLIVGMDPVSGERLWEFNDISGNSSSTPVAIGDGRFLIGSSGGRGAKPASPSCGVIKVEKSADGFTADWSWRAEKASCSFGSPLAFDGKAYFVNRSGIVYCHELETGESVYVERLPAGQIWATPLGAKNTAYFFGKDGTTAVIESGDALKVTSENQLWTSGSRGTGESGDSAGGGRFAGSVLYAAAVSNGKLILRRGDVVYCVESAEN